MIRTRVRRSLVALFHAGQCAVTAAALIACGSVVPADAAESHATTPYQALDARARLDAAQASEYAFFGSALAASGHTVVVGAWGDADAGPNTGAVYVFTLEEDGWAQTARLVASDAAAGARFGHAVAISEDVVLVGAVYDDELGSRSGSVYVFENRSGSWRESVKLHPDDGAEDNLFGGSVALRGSTALVGAAGHTSRAAYIFERGQQGWAQVARFAPAAEDFGRFGASVGLGDELAVVGAPGELEDDLVTAGSLYTYVRTGETWHQASELIAPEESTGQFATSLAVSGSSLVVGSSGMQERVFVYSRSENGWVLETELSPPADGVGQFGVAVDIQCDLMMVGAPGSDARAGAVYVFQHDGAAWSARAKLVAPETSSGPVQLGGAVAIAGRFLASGATGDDRFGTAAGAAFVHTLDDEPLNHGDASPSCGP